MYRRSSCYGLQLIVTRALSSSIEMVTATSIAQNGIIYLTLALSLSLSLLIKMSLCKKDNLKCFRDFLEIKLTEEFYSCTFYLPYTMV